MCGLAGVAGNTSAKIRDAFLDLLLITQLRGRDATGIFTVKADNSTAVCKEVGPPDNLFDRKSFDDCLRGVPKVMAGHCRAKTVGDNNRLNAHPYDYDNVVGMHNGTLKNYYSMEGYDYKRTDSYTLYHNVDRYGIDMTMSAIDEDGAWALVWWDKNENRLNFLRNDKRPLWFAWTKDKTAVFWCSEPWMFSAVSRHVDLWDGKEEGKDPVSPYFQLPVNQHWSFTVNGFTKPGEKYLTFHQPREVKAEGKKPVGFSRPSVGTDTGGEVKNPFQQGCEEAYDRFQRRQQVRAGITIHRDALDDNIDDLNPGESTTSTTSDDASKKTSSNVLDFRPASRRTTNLSKNTLSLPAPSSATSQPSSSANGTAGSSEYCVKESRIAASQTFPKVSLRNVLGTWYISHNDTSQEISLAEFESRTGGNCAYCKAPIGDLTEVAAFTDKALSGFVCTSCVAEPKVALVG